MQRLGVEGEQPQEADEAPRAGSSLNLNVLEKNRHRHP